jgi:hypothetical protein
VFQGAFAEVARRPGCALKLQLLVFATLTQPQSLARTNFKALKTRPPRYAKFLRFFSARKAAALVRSRGCDEITSRLLVSHPPSPWLGPELSFAGRVWRCRVKDRLRIAWDLPDFQFQRHRCRRLGPTADLCYTDTPTGWRIRNRYSSDTRMRIPRYTILVGFLLGKCVSVYLIRIVSDTRTRTRVT